MKHANLIEPSIITLTEVPARLLRNARWHDCLSVMLLSHFLKTGHSGSLSSMAYTKSCLLIDDDLDDQLVFSLALKILDKSILCITANNGYIALKKLEHELPFAPDIIFLDLNLPGIKGVDCLVKIKENPKLSHIPVVIYSTSFNEEDIRKTKNLGAIAFITKPDQIAELTLKLNDFF